MDSRANTSPEPGDTWGQLVQRHGPEWERSVRDFADFMNPQAPGKSESARKLCLLLRGQTHEEYLASQSAWMDRRATHNVTEKGQ